MKGTGLPTLVKDEETQPKKKKVKKVGKFINTKRKRKRIDK
jgi:hypothetical protein